MGSRRAHGRPDAAADQNGQGAAVEGALLGANGLQTCDLSGSSPVVANPGQVVNDGALPDPAEYSTSFPYLATPIAGAVPAN